MSTMTSAAALTALGLTVNRVTAAAGIARAVADWVPDGGDFGKADCLEAVEAHLLRPAAADLAKAYERICDAIDRSTGWGAK